jgi:molybdopterin synthase sulfur carrier subunit
MITVKVRLYPTFLRHMVGETVADGRVEVQIAEGGSILDVVHALGIPEDLVKVMMVNGRPSRLQSALAEGDTVGLFPPLGGG